MQIRPKAYESSNEDLIQTFLGVCIVGGWGDGGGGEGGDEGGGTGWTGEEYEWAAYIPKAFQRFQTNWYKSINDYLQADACTLFTDL